MRWLVAGIGTFLLLVTLYRANLTPTLQKIMASTVATGDSRPSSEIPIKITISPAHGDDGSTTPTSVVLVVTLENTSDKPLSLLRWSSPFDPLASAIGVFSLTSKPTGEQVPCVDLKINRKIPDSRVFSAGDEDIITIKAGEKVQHEVKVKQREVQWKEGGRYLVKAKGKWMGVWIGEGTELSMNDGSDIKVEEFESGELEVEL